MYASLTIIIGFLGSHGGTRHLYYLDIEQSFYVIKLTYVAEPFGIMAVATGKVAVGLLLLRIIYYPGVEMEKVPSLWPNDHNHDLGFYYCYYHLHAVPGPQGAVDS